MTPYSIPEKGLWSAFWPLLEHDMTITKHLLLQVLEGLRCRDLASLAFFLCSQPSQHQANNSHEQWSAECTKSFDLRLSFYAELCWASSENDFHPLNVG